MGTAHTCDEKPDGELRLLGNLVKAEMGLHIVRIVYQCAPC